MNSVAEPFPPDFELKKLSSIKVQFPDVPTDLTFLHTLHVLKKDLPANMEQLVQATDVILLEGYGSHNEGTERDQAISDGDREALNDYRLYFHEGTEFSIALREAFFGSGKAIRPCDISRSRKTDALVESRELLLNATFASQSVAEFVRKGRAFFDLSIKEFDFNRDKYILRNVYSELTQPFAESEPPQSINGLFVLGALHKTVPHMIRRQAQLQGRVDQEVSELFVGDTRDVAAEMYYDFLQGKKYEDIEVLKAFLGIKAMHDVTLKDEILSMSFEEAAKAITST